MKNVDANQENIPIIICPRCKGHGARFKDNGDCHLCNAHGHVLDHGEGQYSNETDTNMYYW